MTVRLAHVSDTHLGYEAYPTLSPAGNNQRGEDAVRSWRRTVDEVVAADPALVIHSGDLADRPLVSTRYMLEARRGLAALAGRRPDGTRRQVVVIAGNHDAPRDRKEPAWLELFASMPGLHVVTRGPQVVTFDDPDVPAELADVAVTAVPHDSLKLLELTDLPRPVDRAVNILTCHGVAEGSALYVRAVGREFPVPVDLLAAGWDYVALGHWHRQGPVPIGSGDPEASVAWYAGSTETIGFGDLRGDRVDARGWLDVTLDGAARPHVVAREHQVRSMVRLPALDVATLTPEEITDRLAQIAASADIEAAVVVQPVTGVRRDLWALVDLPTVRRAAADALHYELSVRHKEEADPDRPAPQSREQSLTATLTEVVERTVPADQRAEVIALARDLLHRSLGGERLPDDPAVASATTSDPPGPAPGDEESPASSEPSETVPS